MRASFNVAHIKRIIRKGFPVFKENGILVRMLDADDSHDAEMFQRFRYHYYVQKFKWLDESVDRKEKDQYDEHAAHFGAFDLENNLIGYSRFILPGCHGLQVRNEFEELVHPRVGLPRNISKCVESSRLVVSPEAGIKRRHVAQMIYKLKYQFMKRLDFKFWYLVSETKVIRALRLQGYPFEIVAPGKEYHGLVRYPAVMSIDEVDQLLIKEHPEYYKWLNEGLEIDKGLDIDALVEPRIHDGPIITDILRRGS